MDEIGTTSVHPLGPPSTLKRLWGSAYQSPKVPPPPAPAQKMGDIGATSAPPLDPLSTLKPSPGSAYQSPKAPTLPSALAQGSDDHFGWEAIGEKRDFYDERDCLHPSHNLVSQKLKNRREDDVVIFDYSLNPDYLRHLDRNRFEGGGRLVGLFNEDDDIFFQVSKDKLIESEQFNQIINLMRGPPLIQSRELRLGIIDFPQCYDAYDDSLLNLMGEKLGLLRNGETAFMDAYSQRVRTLPGRGRFRTGVSLQALFRRPSELAKPGSSNNRFILFVSFPYFGRSSEEISLGPESESVGILDFKRLGVGDPDPRAMTNEEERDPIGEMLVHQARYMIFDNYTMAIFRSKEDSAKDQVPLHRFQERIGAFRAMIHMIANRMDLELWTLEKLQASLCKLEGDIDLMISDAKTYEGSQGMRGIPADEPEGEELQHRVILTEEDQRRQREDHERAQENNLRKKKQRTRDLLTSFNRLSGALFAAISVAERQIAVLRELHSVFLTSCRTKAEPGEKGYPLRESPSYKNIIPIPVLSEQPQQIWSNILDTIDEVVRERKSFVEKIKELVENMDIRRKILFGFLKSDNAEVVPSRRTPQEGAAPSGRTPQEEAAARKRAEETLKRTQAIQVEQVHQTQTLSGVIVVTTAFLPLSFCAEYFGMNNIKEFDEHHLSRRDFWLATGPVCVGITLLTVIIISWQRPTARRFRAYVARELGRPPKIKIDDIENQWQELRSSENSTSAVTPSGGSSTPSVPDTTRLRPP